MKYALFTLALLLAGPGVAQDAPEIAYPDPSLTPGAIRSTDTAAICSTGTRQFRHRDPDRSNQIFESYHIARADRIQYTLDHLVPLEAGGADVTANIWPEPRASLAGEWDDERKYQLEHTLARLICSGQVDVREAREAIRADWPSAWLRFVAARPVASLGPPPIIRPQGWRQRLRAWVEGWR